MLRSFALFTLLAAAAWSAGTERYYFGFLKSAPGRRQLPKEEGEKLQAAHLAHMGEMAKRGGLVCAGPLGGGGVLRGVVIYKTDTIAQAQANADADPAVKAGQLVTEVFPWTGPAGIGEEFMKRYRELGDEMKMKMTKYVLMLARPGHTAANAIAKGPYESREEKGEILIFNGMTPEERKTLEGEGVLPKL